MRCVACNSPHTDRDVVPRAKFIVEQALTDASCYSYKCEACGTAFSYPRYTDSQMNLIYQNYRMKNYDDLRKKHEPQYVPHDSNNESCQQVLNTANWLLQPYLKEPRILDVGGFDGTHTPLREIAETHHVLDPAESELQIGIKVALPEPPYDLVVLANIVEHVSNPFEFLLDWVQHSSKLVFIEVPLANLKKPPSHVHEHQNFFTIAGLVMLAERVKLKILDVKIKNKQILLVARK